MIILTNKCDYCGKVTPYFYRKCCIRQFICWNFKKYRKEVRGFWRHITIPIENKIVKYLWNKPLDILSELSIKLARIESSKRGYAGIGRTISWKLYCYFKGKINNFPRFI